MYIDVLECELGHFWTDLSHGARYMRSRGAARASCPERITSGADVFASDRFSCPFCGPSKCFQAPKGQLKEVKGPGGEVEDADHRVLEAEGMESQPFTNRAKGSSREVEGLLTELLS